eukprot:TRINITY_DN21717_c0_g1_i1.p1 TRINITY_DN21717_c0_g1~~TRINITY_DN21717_c0_g1_i1.p1  ORF type:complete len:660 (-),score=91.31 TRINITY_DN21717_c0_g1_i1:1223-3202(-)
MILLEAPRDVPLKIFHRLGSTQFVVSLQLWAGDDIQTRVLELFRHGQLPTCFYRQTLEYVALAVRETLCEDASSDPLPSVTLGADIGQQSSLPEALKDGASQAMGLDRRIRTLQISGVLPPGRQPWGPQFHLPANSAVGHDVTFWCAYDFLLRHRPAFFRTIGTLEMSYLKGIRDLVLGRSAAISELQRCQSMEMEKVRQEAEESNAAEGRDEEGLCREVQVLVGQHVSEIDALELHWQSEIEQLKVKQKASYRDLVVDFFKQEMELLKLPEEARDTSDGFQGCDDSGDDLLAALSSPLRPTTSETNTCETTSAPAQYNPPSLSRGRLSQISEVRAVFGQRVFFVLRLWVGDIMELAARGEGEDMLGNDDGDGAGPQLPKELLGIGSYGHRNLVQEPSWPRLQAAWGFQRGRGNNSRAAPNIAGDKVFRSPSLRFWEAPDLPAPVSLSPNAYSDRLRGLLIPTPENLKFEAAQAVMLREFAGLCCRVTDFHFPSLEEQLNTVRETAETEAPLRTGDYFCTRHSNLGGQVQVAFHFLGASSESPASDGVPAATHRALKRVVWDCHRCRVSELSLPLLLLDIGTSESSLPYAVAQRRAENTLRALKGALMRLSDELAPSELPGLEVLNLVLPLSSAQSVSASMPSVARSAQTFLQHSFQCV